MAKTFSLLNLVKGYVCAPRTKLRTILRGQKAAVDRQESWNKQVREKKHRKIYWNYLKMYFKSCIETNISGKGIPKSTLHSWNSLLCAFGRDKKYKVLKWFIFSFSFLLGIESRILYLLCQPLYLWGSVTFEIGYLCSINSA